MATPSVKDIVRLSSRLREEHLFVQAEQRNLRGAFNSILGETELLHKRAWLSWHAKLLGDQFVDPNIFTFLSSRSIAAADSNSVPGTAAPSLQRSQFSPSVEDGSGRKGGVLAQLHPQLQKQYENDVKKQLCRRYHNIENCALVDAARAFSSRVSAYSDLVTRLRREPEQLAEFISHEFDDPTQNVNNTADASTYSAAVFHAVHTVLGPLHGFFTFSEDQNLSFSFVKKLMQLQFTAKSSPRQIMKHATMPFPAAFKMLAEHLHEAKVFLVTALRTALLDVVANDSIYWDADPLKAMYHFSAVERRDRFGQEGTEHFCQKLAQYQRKVIDNIVRVSRAVIEGIQQSIYCFPANLASLFSDVHAHLTTTFPSHPNLATLICTESLFTYFICSAIVYPEAFTSMGNDIFISRVARYNLTQIAQVLQTLAISKWESISPSSGILMTILGHFEPDQVWGVLDQVLEIGRSYQAIQQQRTLDYSTNHNNNTQTMPVDESHMLSGSISTSVTTTNTASRRPSAASSSIMLMDDDGLADSYSCLNQPKRAALFISVTELEILTHMARLLAARNHHKASSSLPSNVRKSHSTQNNTNSSHQKLVDKLRDSLQRISFSSSVHTSIIPFAVQQQGISRNQKNSKVQQQLGVSAGSLTSLRDEINHIMLREQQKHLHANQQNSVLTTIIVLPLSDVPLLHEHYPGGLSEAEVVGMHSSNKRHGTNEAMKDAEIKPSPISGNNFGRKASLSSLGKASSTASIAPKTLDEQDSIDDEAHSAFSAYSYQSSVPESAAYHQRAHDQAVVGSSAAADSLSAVSEEFSNSVVNHTVTNSEQNNTPDGTNAPFAGPEDTGGGNGRHSRGGSSMEMNAEDAACVAAVIDDADVMDAINSNNHDREHHHRHHRHHRRHHHRIIVGGDDEVDDDDDEDEEDDVRNDVVGGRSEARSDAPDDTMSECYYANSVVSGRASIDEAPGDDADNDADDDDDDVEDTRMLSPSATTILIENGAGNTLMGVALTTTVTQVQRPADTLGLTDAGRAEFVGVGPEPPPISSVPEKFATFADVKDKVEAGVRDFDARSDAAWSTEVTASDTETAGGSNNGDKRMTGITTPDAATPSTPSKKRNHESSFQQQTDRGTSDNNNADKTISRSNRSASSSASSLVAVAGDDIAVVDAVRNPTAGLSLHPSSSSGANVARMTSARSTGGLPLRKSTSSSSSSHLTTMGAAGGPTIPLEDIDSDRWSTGVCLSDSERAGLDDSMADLSLAELDVNAATPRGVVEPDEDDDDVGEGGSSLVLRSDQHVLSASPPSLPTMAFDGQLMQIPSAPEPSAIQQQTPKDEERDPFMPYTVAPRPQQQQPAPILSRPGRHSNRSASATAAASESAVQHPQQQQPRMQHHSLSFSELESAAEQSNVQAAGARAAANQLSVCGISSPAKSVSFAHEPLFHHYHQQEEIIVSETSAATTPQPTSSAAPVSEINSTVTKAATLPYGSNMTHLQQKFIDETTISTRNSIGSRGTNLPSSNSSNRTAVSRPMDLDGDSEVVGRSPPKRTRRLSEFSKIFAQTKLRLKNSNTIASALGRAGGRLSEPVVSPTFQDAPQSAGIVWEQKQQRPLLMPLSSERHRIESTDDILTKYRTLPVKQQQLLTTANDLLGDFPASDGHGLTRADTPVVGGTGAGEDAEMRSDSAANNNNLSTSRPVTPQVALLSATSQPTPTAEAGAAEIATFESNSRENVDKSHYSVAPELLFEAAKRKLRAAMNSIDVHRGSCAPFDYPLALLHASTFARNPSHQQFLSADSMLHRPRTSASSSSIVSDNDSFVGSIAGEQHHTLLTFLRIQLAECIAVGERQQVALLRETIRIIRFLLEATQMRRQQQRSQLMLSRQQSVDADANSKANEDAGNTNNIDADKRPPFDAESHEDDVSASAACLQALLDSLNSDFSARESYVAYLVRCRQGLLRTRQQLQSLGHRYQCEARTYSTRFVDFLIENFLLSQQHEQELTRFVGDFQRSHVLDEKIEMLSTFRTKLQTSLDSELDLGRVFAAEATTMKRQNQFRNNSFEIQQTNSSTDSSSTLAAQLHDALERHLMSRVYYDALFPNGEPDRERDEILHSHINKLKHHVTADHRDLAIKQVFRLDMPWISAQVELAALNAYKTPRDKVQCVLRSCLALMSLLSSAVESSSAAGSSSVAADDFVPALVYTVLQVNPPHLLSTVQYVNAFYGGGIGDDNSKLLQGEAGYYWTQFSSAVEFIKTMG